MKYYHCFDCRRVAPISKNEERKCVSCQSTRGEVMASDKLKAMLDAGAIFNLVSRARKRRKETNAENG